MNNSEQPSAEDFIRAALYASLVLSPRTPGLTEDELVVALGTLGKQRGEVRDALKHFINNEDVEWSDSGRVFGVDRATQLHLDFVFGFEDDPRDAKASVFIHRWVRELADRLGVRDARFGRSEILSAAQDHGYRERDVDYTLEVLTRKGLIARAANRDTYQPTDMIRTNGIIGAQKPASVRRWHAFSLVLPHVESLLRSRDPAQKQQALVEEIVSLKAVGPTSEAAKVLTWTCQRFVDTAAPVSLDDIEAAFPATLGARAITHRLSEMSYVGIVDSSTMPRAIPTVRAAMLMPPLFAEVLVLLDDVLRRAGKLRREKRANDAPLNALLDPKVGSPSARELAKHMLPSLRPIVAGNPPNTVVGIHDLARDYDLLPKFLEYKLATDWHQAPSKSEEKRMTSPGTAKQVFIIHGRNMELVEQLRIWLDAIGLHAKAFEDLRVEMGGSVTILQVIEKGMSEARAIIALMTPDELAFLRPELRRERDNQADLERWQARPNVIFEAGMAFALGKDRTLLLVAGGAELFSDLGGIHYLSVPHDAAGRERLRTQLKSMGCEVREDSSQHHNRGNFSAGPLTRPPTRSPFDKD